MLDCSECVIVIVMFMKLRSHFLRLLSMVKIDHEKKKEKTTSSSSHPFIAIWGSVQTFIDASDLVEPQFFVHSTTR